MTGDLEELESALRAGDVVAFGSLADHFARNRHPEVQELLLQALQHPHPEIRAASAQAAGLLGSPEAVAPLFLLLQDPESEVRQAARAALIHLAPPLLERDLRQRKVDGPHYSHLWELVAVLPTDPKPGSGGEAVEKVAGSNSLAIKLCIALLHHPSSAVRVRAADFLGVTQDRRAIDELLLALTHADPETREAVAIALGEHGKTSRIVGPLVEAFHDVDARVRVAAALALSRVDVLSSSAPMDRLRPVLEHLLRHPDVEARRRVVLMLGRSRGPESVELLLQSANDREASVRAESIVALSRFRDPRIEPALRMALTDPDEMVRLRAVDAMERLGTPEPLPLALKDPSPTVRVQAIKALRWTGAEPVLPELLFSLADPAEAVRLEVVELLTSHPTPTVIVALAQALPTETFPLIRQKMLAALGAQPEANDESLRAGGLARTVRDTFREHLMDPAPEVRAQVVQFLGEKGGMALLPHLLAQKHDEAAEVRRALARTLESVEAPEATGTLRALLADPAAEVRETAVWSLRHRSVDTVLALTLPLLADPAESVRQSVAVLLAYFHLRRGLPLERFASIYRTTPLGGRLALLEASEGIRDRRLVPLLLGAIDLGTGEERTRALQILIDLKRGDAPSRPPRLIEELHRQAPLESVGTRSAIRVLDPAQTPPLSAALPLLEEPVQFYVTAPERIAPGSRIRVEVWAARPEQLERVLSLAQRPVEESDHRIQSRYGPTLAPRTSLSALLLSPRLSPVDNEDDLHWEGEPASARFVIGVPETTAPGVYPVRVALLREGLRIATVTTSLEVGSPSASVVFRQAAVTRYHQGVARVARQDREAVQARLASLRRVLPGLKVEVLGEEEPVPESAEVVYLFWSRAAEAAGIVAEPTEKVSPLPLEVPQSNDRSWIWGYLRGRLRA